MVDDALQIPSSASTSSPTTSSCHSALYLPEILAKIMSFSIYRPDTTKTNRWSRTPFTSKTNPPWVFLLVSKFWGTVALKTPWLWSTFIARVPYTPRDRGIVDIPRMVDLHMICAKQEPLTLEMYWCGEHPTLIMRSVFLKLWAKQKQWEDVRLYVALRMDRMWGKPATPEPASFMLRLNDIPMLKRLDIDICPEPHVRSGKLVIGLGPAPLLETLSIGETTKFRIIPPSDLPTTDIFPKLTTISMSPKFLDQYFNCWKLLEATPHVEKLCLKCGQHFFHPRRTIALPKLQHLVMNFDTVRPEEFLQHCYSPSLQRLELKQCTDMFANLRTALQSLPIKELSVEVVDMGPYDPEYLVDFLQAVGALRWLQIYDDTPTYSHMFAGLLNSLAIALQPESSPEPLLSGLSSFELRIRISSFFDEVGSGSIRSVINVVQAFRRKCHTLFHLSVTMLHSDTRYSVFPFKDVEDMLCEDPEILECLSKDFVVTVNGKILSK
ncbi:hypothetical protein SCHPADRAFT_927876 [Schizopora paradoxa]|uniref:F-box domain-containing protein n=1 Tax=Schizopora paradoxa TaxID=27342 RepID=A0A0H2RR50_9AGAM|nr:hypothetical protein SCHPADRAFT_927876 [Schizopora paradoxa]